MPKVISRGHQITFEEYAELHNSGLISTHEETVVSEPMPPIQTSAAKNDKEKVDLSLIPGVFLEAVARAFMVGEKKYGRYNYCKGHKASQLLAAMARHWSAYNDGEENDPIDGQPHLGSIGACIAMLLRQKELGTLKDDRFKKEDKA